MAETGSSIMKSVWSGKNNRIFLAIVCTIIVSLTGCDDYPTHQGEGFYSYRGFRDWWRVPLKFPYQITMIDTFDQGRLEKYDASSLIADPKCTTLAENITAVGYDDKFALFQQKDNVETFGVLVYSSGLIRSFATEKELADFIKLNYPDTALPKMVPLEKFYNLMWQAIDKIKQTDPQKLAY